MTKFAGTAEPLSNKGFMDVLIDLQVGILELLAVLAAGPKVANFYRIDDLLFYLNGISSAS